MSVLRGQNILLGISASIAAYKCGELVRQLVKNGANVRVIQTPASTEFITPLTLSTLSNNPVLTEFVDVEKKMWNNHVELGLWADIFLIAPASSNTISKMASGECDNLLLTSYMSAKCPVFFAPAMDLDMYAHPSTQKNIKQLVDFGNFLIPAEDGELASGLVGKGRMAESQNIVRFITNEISLNFPLSNKKFLITAGPTYEAIDSVRFIGNHSSGKMGMAIAKSIANKGGEVNLIMGPSSVICEHPNINRIDVVNAQQMFDATVDYFEQSDVAIMSAAVSDYKPTEIVNHKIKKSESKLELQLESTKDILHFLGTKKNQNQLLIGFALETDNEEQNAKEKIKNKNLDFIVLNSLNDNGAGFKHDTNKITIIDKNNKMERYELKPKNLVAEDIVNYLIKLL